MIDSALTGAGWTRHEGYNHVSSSSYTGGVPTSDPSGLAADGDYIRCTYQCNDSKSGTSPLFLFILYRIGTSNSFAVIDFEIGTGASGSGATLSISGFSGKCLGLLNNTTFTSAWGAFCYASAYESGLAVSLSDSSPGNAVTMFCIERCRDMNGAITNDIAAFNGEYALSYATSRPASGTPFTTSSFPIQNCYTVKLSGGETGISELVFLKGAQTSMSSSNHTTLSPTIASDTLVLLGPYLRGGTNTEMYGRPRLIVFVPAGSFGTLGSDAAVSQDGVTRTFRVNEHSYSANGAKHLIAKT